MLRKKLMFWLHNFLFFSFKGFFFFIIVKLIKHVIGLQRTLNNLLFLEKELQRCFFHRQNLFLNGTLEKLINKNVLLVTAQEEIWGSEMKCHLLEANVNLTQGFIVPLGADLDQEEEFRFFSQGIDWQTGFFPSFPESFDYIVVSPALARLGHRAMFLRWLTQRYNCKQFILQLPALRESVYHHIQLYRGQRLISSYDNGEVLYQRKSLALDFGLWYDLKKIDLLKNQSLYQITLEEKIPQQKEYSTPFFSIIVPIYNIEDYLENCLDSILAQTFKSFEVLLVNDASPDNSQKIIDLYVAKDKRFRCLKHEYNQGLGPSRNTGMKAASGNYFFFLDSDDFIHPASLETLAYSLEQHLCEGVCFRFYCSRFCNMLNGNSYVYRNNLQSYRSLTNGSLYNSYNAYNAWSKVIKREKKMTLFSKRFYEDIVFSAVAVQHMEKLLYVPINLYYYRIRSGSIMQKPFSWRQINDHSYVLKNMSNFFVNKLSRSLPLEFLEIHFNFIYDKLSTLPTEERQSYTLRMWELPGMSYDKWLDHKQLQNDFRKIYKLIRKDETQAFVCLEKIYKKVKFYRSNQQQLFQAPLFELFNED